MTLTLNLPAGRQAFLIQPNVGGGHAVKRPPGQVHLDFLPRLDLILVDQLPVFPNPSTVVDVEQRRLVDAALDLRADRLDGELEAGGRTGALLKAKHLPRPTAARIETGIVLQQNRVVVTERRRLLEPLLRNRDRFFLPLERQQEPPMHVRPRRDVADISRRAVVPDHPVRQHGKIVTLCMLTFTEGTPTIHRIADHEVAVVVNSGPCRRKDSRLGDVILDGLCVVGLLRKHLVCGK